MLTRDQVQLLLRDGRLVLPAGTGYGLHWNRDEQRYESRGLDADVTVELTIDQVDLCALVATAITNRGRKSKAGPMRVKVYEHSKER